MYFYVVRFGKVSNRMNFDHTDGYCHFVSKFIGICTPSLMDRIFCTCLFCWTNLLQHISSNITSWLFHRKRFIKNTSSCFVMSITPTCLLPILMASSKRINAAAAAAWMKASLGSLQALTKDQGLQAASTMPIGSWFWFESLQLA